VTHLLETADPYICCLSSIFNVHLVGIPYSTNASQVAKLRAAGYQITVPEDLSQIGPLAVELIGKLAARRPVVVQEIGGYLALHAPTLSRIPNFLGIVEDTNNGHWRYAASAHALQFPVLSIARSPIKAIEDAQIGPAVVFSVERLLREHFGRVMKGLNVLILGYGKIGSSTAAALRRREANVSIFDTDPVKMLAAHMEGYGVGPQDRLLRDASLVIGASGHCSIDKSALHCIRNGAILASASSRQVEFDMESLKQYYTGEIQSSTVVRYYARGQFFYVLSDGFPVNFGDQSIIGDALDAVYAELFLCIREIAERRVAPGLADSGPELHREIGETWHGLNFGVQTAAAGQGFRIGPRSQGIADQPRRNRRIG
jgi:adenosylhomocysteinase